MPIRDDDPIIRNHKVWAALGLLAVVCVVVTLATSPVFFRKVADLWIMSDSLEKPADAIVVLGGGYDRRLRAAVALYKRGMGKEIWIIHAKEQAGASQSEAKFSRALLVNLGMPESAMVDVPGEASSTYEETELVSHLLSATGIKSLIIPTDPFHTVRVKWAFTKLVGDRGIKVIVRPIFMNINSPGQLGEDAQSRTEFAKEVAKYLYYRIRY